MSNDANVGPVNLTNGVPALILQRAGAAAAGFRPARDHWILVAKNGGTVRRVEKDAGNLDAPREAADEHAFLVAGTGEEEQPRARIVRMVVDIESADGKVKTGIEIPVSSIDALFFGEGAVQKFMVPYYTAAFSIEYGMKIADKWRYDTSVAAFCHAPWSEDCTEDGDGLHERGTLTI